MYCFNPEVLLDDAVENLSLYVWPTARSRERRECGDFFAGFGVDERGVARGGGGGGEEFGDFCFGCSGDSGSELFEVSWGGEG